jgi:hypothetical protein
LPWLGRVRQRLDGEAVTFLNLGWEADASEAAWREAITAHGLGGTHLLTDESLRDAWGLVKTPTFLLLDRDGTILTVSHSRARTRDERWRPPSGTPSLCPRGTERFVSACRGRRVSRRFRACSSRIFRCSRPEPHSASSA